MVGVEAGAFGFPEASPGASRSGPHAAPPTTPAGPEVGSAMSREVDAGATGGAKYTVPEVYRGVTQ